MKRGLGGLGGVCSQLGPRAFLRPGLLQHVLKVLATSYLGMQVQDQVMDWMCEREMNIYQSAFGGAAGSGTLAAQQADDRGAAEVAAHATRLDKFEQRFAWFRQRLDAKRELWGVFPAHWRVPQVVVRVCVCACCVRACL